MPLYEDALVSYENWRLTRGGASPNTVRGEQPGLRAAGRFLGNPQLCDITAEDIGRWWDALTVADSTKGTRLTQLRSFFRYCRDQAWLSSDPTSLLRAPKVQPVPRERLTAQELLGLLDLAATPRDRCLLALAMNLAVRGGEIQRMRWRDVHLGSGTIRVYVDKTNEVDDMPISGDLQQELQRWLGVWLAEVGAPQGEHFLIPSQHSTQAGLIVYRPTRPVAEPYEVVKRALNQIGWDTKQEGVHTIRRSVARLYFDMVEENETFDSALLATMTLLHHTRPETTLRYVGRDRATLARDRILRGNPFLTALRAPVNLRSVS